MVLPAIGWKRWLCLFFFLFRSKKQRPINNSSSNAREHLKEQIVVKRFCGKLSEYFFLATNYYNWLKWKTLLNVQKNWSQRIEMWWTPKVFENIKTWKKSKRLICFISKQYTAYTSVDVFVYVLMYKIMRKHFVKKMKNFKNVVICLSRKILKCSVIIKPNKNEYIDFKQLMNEQRSEEWQ